MRSKSSIVRITNWRFPCLLRNSGFTFNIVESSLVSVRSMADAFDRNHVAGDIEQDAPIADTEPVFGGIVGQPLYIAGKGVGQPVDLGSDAPRDIRRHFLKLLHDCLRVSYPV